MFDHKRNVTLTAGNLILSLLVALFIGAFIGGATNQPSLTRAEIKTAMREVIDSDPLATPEAADEEAEHQAALEHAKHYDWRAAAGVK